jgi:3-oxoacyl-[acyl-carrier protein] reductase
MWENIAEKLSEINKSDINELKRTWADKIPLKRLAKPEDIANVILFLCSNEASYITGQIINVCGGLSLI